jgi:hypothetical protein
MFWLLRMSFNTPSKHFLASSVLLSL